METTLSNYREETKRRAADERKKAIEEERRKEEARQRVEEEERRRAEEARVSERKFKEQSNGLRHIWVYEKLGKIQLQQLRMLYSNSRNGATPSFFP